MFQDVHDGIRWLMFIESQTYGNHVTCLAAKIYEIVAILIIAFQHHDVTWINLMSKLCSSQLPKV